MTDPNEVAQLIKNSIPGAQVQVEDMTGTGDHFQIFVVSQIFKGKMLLEQHRLIQQALKEAMDDGRIHAVHIKTQTAQEPGKDSRDDDDFKIVN